MKIVKINGIILDHGLWVMEELGSSDVISEVVNNLDGGIIVFEQIKRTSRKNMTLVSKETGWLSKATVDALLALANGSIGQTYVIEDDSAVTYNVRFRHEESGGAVQFTRLVDAKLSNWFTGTIYLGRV